MIYEHIKRIIPQVEIRDHGSYDDMADLSLIFNHPIIEDISGVWRWKPNALIERLLDRDEVASKWHMIDLNQLAVDYCDGRFSLEEYMKLNMDTGYSLCGFADIFSAELIARVIKAHTEDPSGWMITRTKVKRGER